MVAMLESGTQSPAIAATDVAVNIERVSKLYRIGAKVDKRDTLGEALLRFFKSPVANLRKYRSLYNFDDVEGPNAPADVLWALKDISLTIDKGDAIGIIGRNGAGKSTLLKILSRITPPTSGRITITGRVSSLLEVGTGFHPELSGRENIYLNSTVLGLKKAEVDQRFDSIVAFSGIERFLDTPVKRYSSGMSVRLAFAVAAHLEPEILIVDEVLAVGDAEFQQKCLGKMQDVAGGGRTVIFVSHNMAAISNLCRKAAYLRGGELVSFGDSKTVIDEYLASVSGKARTPLGERSDRIGSGELRFTSVELLSGDRRPIDHPQSGQPLIIRLGYETTTDKTLSNCRVSVAIFKDENPQILLGTDLVDQRRLDLRGRGAIEFAIPRLPLSMGNYLLSTYIDLHSTRAIVDWVQDAAEMAVIDGDFYGTGKLYPTGWAGKTVLVDHSWSLADDA